MRTNAKDYTLIKKTTVMIGVVTVFALLLFGFFLSIRRFRTQIPLRNSYNNNFNNNGNMELLKELNNDWELPKDYQMETININDLEANWIYQNSYKDSNKVILQLHGGAYTRSLEDNGITYQRMAVNYAGISGARVLTIDYRVAPEYPYPAALEDAVAAYQWLMDQGYLPEDIIIAGDSAGGGLALATTLYLRDNNQPIPAALITMSPWTNLDYKRINVPYIGENDSSNPYISPVYGDYTGFPKMLIQVGGDEELLNDSTLVAKAAEEAGVDVNLSVYDGMFHVFQALVPVLENADEAWEEVEEFILTIYSIDEKK